jgi:hypothetical protein
MSVARLRWICRCEVVALDDGMGLFPSPSLLFLSIFSLILHSFLGMHGRLTA